MEKFDFKSNGKTCKRILENLFKAEELNNSNINRRMKS